MDKEHIRLEIDSFGNSFLGVTIAVCLLIILFRGDPNIVDALRIIFLNWAGLEAV